MSKYKAIITTAGAAKIAAATAGGTQLKINRMAVGDGNGALPTPNPAQTKLVNEKYRAALNGLTIGAVKNNIVAELIIPADVGGFWLREMGLYDEAGTLIAVGNMAESYKPKLAEGSGRTQTLRMILIVSSTEAIQVIAGGDTVLATKDFVADAIAAHEKTRNHPDASTTAKGLVQLSSATTSTDETKAATPKAVKDVNDASAKRAANLSDLTDKAAARGNLALGTAATKNVGTGAGQLMEVGAFGLGGRGFEFDATNDADLMSSLKAQGSCFFRNKKDGTAMPTWGPGIYSWAGDANSMIAINPFSGNVVAAGFTDGNTSMPRINTLYGTANKPTAADVDAVSASQGGEFKKEILASGGVAVSYGGDVRPGGIFPGNGDYASYDTCNMDIKSWFGIGFYNTCPNAGIQGRTAFMSVRTGDFSTKGRITGAQVWDGNARVYSPANKPTAADVGALTDTQAAQKYALRSIKINGKPISSDVNLLAGDVNAWNKTESDSRYLMLTGGTVNGDIGTQRLVFPGASVVDGADDINRKNGFMIESFSGNSKGYPAELGTLISFTIGENRNAQFAVASGKPDLFLRSIRKDSPGRSEKWTQVYTTDYKPTAADVGALTDTQAAQKYALRSIKVNGKPISADVNLLAGDVNAWNKTESDGRYVKQTGDTMKGPLTAPYCTTPGGLPEGSGAYGAQLDSKAPFYQANFEWEVSTGGHYVPLVKGKSTRKGKGWPTAVSYGYLLLGDDQHAHPVIHAKGDGGVECIWDFNPKTGRISSKAGEFSPLQETMNALYPVGIVAFFGNLTNPNQAFQGQVWEDLSAKGFDRRVLALGYTPLSTGGTNSVRITPHHLPDHSHKGGMRAPGKQWGTTETGTDNSSPYALGLTTETFTDGMGNEHVRNDLLDVTNAYVNLRGWLRVA
ncbi:phage tail-collar fiber domain-containing protein [Serratia entomophila]|uniref:phage tail-collar fiber domain-containing protein n=1 Tax=Serratia entomophila TaxID=42906 RepID=UPI00217AF3A8|nr:phage tail protein [Serratia entomophila]CAI1078214.1 Phage T4 tail fibre [Serratia entomophila]CAI1743022.1 Phage T4 tail fibre [Serratia entomophila]CAI1763429.1 Phage T4 tail fibre [Serratia entomophila]CAI1808148.1 Phage T4 tail fibre [Serratia entomophila]CAI1853391.1 Phage T4 tail fibre [Serratia entomophila]